MMIQDIGPHRLRNQYSERTESGPDSPVFVFMGPKLLIKENTEHYFEQKAGKAFDGTRVSMPEAGIEWNEEKQFYRERGRFLRLPEREELGVGEKDLTYLFTVDERPTFLLRKALKDEEIPEGFSFIDIRTMRQAAYGPPGTGTTVSAAPAVIQRSIPKRNERCAVPPAGGRSIRASFRRSLSA